jgi:hypothetical protein
MTADPEFVKALSLCAGAAAVVVVGALLFRRSANRAAQSPRAVLRRCRLELHMVRGEVSMLPADKAMHEIFRGIENCCRTIDRVEREYAREGR